MLSMVIHEAEELCRELMATHGLTDGWSVVLNDKTREFGSCEVRIVFGEFVYGTIRLSRPLIRANSKERVRKTILHEIAHALANLEVRGDAGHGPVWKKHARELGLQDPKAHWTHKDTVEATLRYTGTCSAGHTHTRDRLPKYQLSCAKCRPEAFDASCVITWKRNA